jgi:hypothetical protein
MLYRDLLREACGREGVGVWSCCLMPDHVHLILVPRNSEGLGRALGKAHRRYCLRQRAGAGDRARSLRCGRPRRSADRSADRPFSNASPRRPAAIARRDARRRDVKGICAGVGVIPAVAAAPPVSYS